MSIKALLEYNQHVTNLLNDFMERTRPTAWSRVLDGSSGVPEIDPAEELRMLAQVQAVLGTQELTRILGLPTMETHDEITFPGFTPTIEDEIRTHTERCLCSPVYGYDGTLLEYTRSPMCHVHSNPWGAKK